MTIHGYPRGAPSGRRASAAAASLTHWAASLEFRKATGSLLVELFFDLVAMTHTDRFVEAGAKEASASVRALGIAGITSVTAFEANPYTYKRFASSLDDVPLRYEHAALSDAPGAVAFRVLRAADGRPTANGRGSLLERVGYAPGFETVSVPAVTLDGFFVDDRRRATALWIDVEGASGAVLRGACRTLDEATVVIVEVEERAFWEGDHWLRPAVVEYLDQHRLTPVARDLQSRFQHNIVFLHAEALGKRQITTRLDKWADDVRRLVRAGANPSRNESG